MLWQIIHNLGFSEKESKIYISLLELGTQPASTIAKKAGLNRTTCYTILDDLQQKGLVSHFKKYSVQYYTANDPEAILKYLDSEKTALENKKELLNANLSNLKDINAKLGIKPNVQFFEGLEGIKAAYEDTLTEDKELLAFSGVYNMPPDLKEYIYGHYIPTRIKNKVKMSVIEQSKNFTQKNVELNKKEYRESRLAPIPFELGIEINIYKNKVAFMTFEGGEYSGVVIHNDKLYQAFVLIHKLCWKFSKKT
jgi:sugar-specific transcriptional regulator TrmB